jgi:hypothetical protein
MSKNFRALL